MNNQNIIKAIELIVKDEKNVSYSVNSDLAYRNIFTRKPHEKITRITIEIKELI